MTGHVPDGGASSPSGRGRVLCLVNRPPYPLSDGARKRGFHTARLLARHHDVDLVAVDGSAGAGEPPAALARHFDAVRTFEHGRTRRWFGTARAALTGRPARVGRYRFGDVDRWLDRNLHRYDLAFCTYVDTAEYVRERPCPRVVDLVDAMSTNYRQRAELDGVSTLGGLACRVEARRLSAYEREVVEQFDHAFVTTAADRSDVAEPAGTGVRGAVSVLPNGVDGRFLDAPDEDSRDWLVFLGRMDYHPNVDAVTYFAHEVLPGIRREHPTVEFVVVGTAPSEPVERLARREGIRVTGYVEDPAAYLARAKVVVAPMRYGTGIQNKVLEGMAVGRPVVTTPLGLTGIDAEPGEHLVVADGARETVGAVSDLLVDPSRRRKLGTSAGRLVRERYTWDAVGHRLNEVVRGVLVADGTETANGERRAQ